MLKLENILKGILFTIIGVVIMSLAIYGWWMDQLTDIKAITCLVVGFIFAGMRTKLDDIVTAFLKKFFGIETEKRNRDNHQGK